MNDVAVRVADLSVRVGEHVLVEQVSFDLLFGGITALVGESGSGKTTTGLALIGEFPHNARVSGDVRIAGNVPHRITSQPRSGSVAYVPQHASAALNPARKIGGVLTEIAGRHTREGHPNRRDRRRAVRAKVLEALDRVSVPDPRQIVHRYPHQLSGGQQQRVLLAQALLCSANIVIADEPTTGQDALTCRRVIEELGSLAELGMTVLLLTHDLRIVHALAQRMMVMRNGMLIEQGAASEVLRSPRHPYTKSLIRSQFGCTRHAQSESSCGDPILSAHDLVARHGSKRGHKTALSDISFDMRTGQRVAIVGRSGSGKTTLARCIAGLHSPVSGEIALAGNVMRGNIRRRSIEQRAAIQYVFQDARASFNEFVPVLDQVMRTAIKLRGVEFGVARDTAVDLFDQMGIDVSTANRLPGSLSGGELRRSALVRALLAEPQVLICDEITSGLDTVRQEGIVELLRGLATDRECALIMITHDLGVAASLAERVIVLDRGRIVEETGPAELFTSQDHELTQTLVRAHVAAEPASLAVDIGMVSETDRCIGNLPLGSAEPSVIRAEGRPGTV